MALSLGYDPAAVSKPVAMFHSISRQSDAASLEQLLQLACGVRSASSALSAPYVLFVMSVCRVFQGQEATAALLTQSRQYFSLTADFSEDVGGAAKVSTARTPVCAAGSWQLLPL